ncbi:hypothetical protein EB72_25460 [Mycobacterium sp. SWH-M1]|nr:hypothetical protein EB72_25460 [Mycobacterium sp. SWH-M1]
MPGIAEIALAGAPIAGGALLGVAAGNLRPPDIRALIVKDMDLLDRIPAEQVERRAELQRVIDIRIDDLIGAVDKNRELRQLAASYEGNWRDIVVFICAVLFTIVWWNVDHSRTNWVLMIVLSILAGVYAARGILRGLASFLKGRRTSQ